MPTNQTTTLTNRTSTKTTIIDATNNIDDKNLRCTLLNTCSITQNVVVACRRLGIFECTTLQTHRSNILTIYNTAQQTFFSCFFNLFAARRLLLTAPLQKTKSSQQLFPNQQILSQTKRKLHRSLHFSLKLFPQSTIC
jgi:hypothetical protein